MPVLGHGVELLTLIERLIEALTSYNNLLI